MRARQAPAEQKCGKRGAVALEQPLQIARRHAKMRGDAADRNIPTADIFDDIDLCRPQSGGTHAATFGTVLSFAGGPKRQRHQIAHVGGDMLPQRNRLHRVIIAQQRVGVACQQPERGGIAGNALHDRIIDINDRR